MTGEVRMIKLSMKLLSVLLLGLLLSSSGEKPVVLRTFAVEMNTASHDSTAPAEYAYWSFHYNEDGVLDSLSYNGRISRQLSGLSKMKPFITEMYDWECLPPNPGFFIYDMFRSLRLVITEPEPGKIRILQSQIYSSDSIGPLRTIEYDYDTSSGRVLRFGGYLYTYEDSAGYLIRITQRSDRSLCAVWNLTRDADGSIIGIEHMVMGMRRDSLRLRNKIQILKWGQHRALNSARSRHSVIDPFERFPWLPEGEPVAWIASRRNLGGISAGRLTERIFDQSGRLIRESDGRGERSISYHADGPILIDRQSTEGRLEQETGLMHHTVAKGMVWDDVVLGQIGDSKFGKGERYVRYEYSYRYSDKLCGDRFAPFLMYKANEDTVQLTIKEPLSTKGLTACVIDTNETEMWQIPLVGRQATLILPLLPNHETEMHYAVRGKYEGRKIVDQAF